MVHKGRVYFITVFLIAGFFVLIWRLAILQIIHGEAMSKRAEGLHTTTITIQSERGQIFDRKGVPLALNVPSYSIFWRRTQRPPEKEKLKILFTLVNKDWEHIERKIEQGAKFIYLARSAGQDYLKAVKENLTEGIEWKEGKKRFYPYGKLASHVIGFVGTDGGLEGIEKYYGDLLRGKPGLKLVERDARGNILYTLEKEFYSPQRGYDIYLTIDSVIQYIVEKEMEEIQNKFEPKNSIVIALEPKTGRIMAMATFPSYDPNRFREFNSAHFRNRAISDCFEPGSVFKIITASIALEEGSISPGDRIFCENGVYRMATHTIHDVHPYGWLTFAQALANSSNIAFAKIGTQIGKERLYRYIREFGFGERTGIDLQGESPGLFRSINEWSKLSVVTLSFGQEIGVTPLQLASAVGAVANSGILMRPFIVDKIVDENGNLIKKNRPTVRRRVISPETAEILTSLLVGVVENGTGKPARIEGYKIAGKTGTAQKYIPGEGYSHKKFTSSFIGYAPASDPKVLLLVMVDEPNGAYYGSQVAAPPFKNIMEKVLRHLEISPEFPKERVKPLELVER
ncbi:MAG TPA: penicillin-binding protein 2 [Candidatus Omnitrophica bacterium]|nr:penicillin-binding protein 2 [Candidatus Omnitrophota bacterium]